jgi:hypothetical protein
LHLREGFGNLRGQAVFNDPQGQRSCQPVL